MLLISWPLPECNNPADFSDGDHTDTGEHINEAPTLRGVCTLLQEDDPRLHHERHAGVR